MVKFCQNRTCKFSNGCRCASASAPKTITAAGGEKRTVPECQPVRCESLQFILRCDHVGWLGILHITGIVEDNIIPQLKKLEHDELPTLAGLLLIYNSGGGSYLAGEALERFVLLARQGGPVVSYVRDAQSTVLLPMVAADAVFGDRNVTTGGFGMAYLFCDGREPSAVVSRQTPKKLSGPGIPWPPRSFGDEEKKNLLQRAADETCARDLSLISGYTGRSEEQLAPFLDGRTLGEVDAVNSRLIEKICSEDEAYNTLLTMANRGKKSLNKEKKP